MLLQQQPSSAPVSSTAGRHFTSNNGMASATGQQQPLGRSSRRRPPSMNPHVGESSSSSILHSMHRKHRSLDGSQFLSRLDGASAPFTNNYHKLGGGGGFYQQQKLADDVGSGGGYQVGGYSSSLMAGGYHPTHPHHLPEPMPNNFDLGYTVAGGFDAFENAAGQNATASFLDDFYVDPVILQREFAALREKYNDLYQLVRNSWSPDLHAERLRRKEEALQLNEMQLKLCRQASEIHSIRNELEKREYEIAQLLSDSDLIDMEAELRRLRQQTLKTKLERSELSLGDKCRELQDLQIRMRCVEEQKAEVEKRNEILSKSFSTNESHLKMLNEDLDALRAKLEMKNQQLEARNKAIKNMEQELQTHRTKLNDLLQLEKDGERRTSQLVHKMDQLDVVIREKDAQMEQLKQRLLHEPGNRLEVELHQRLEQSLDEKRRLEDLIDAMRRNAETEKQQQLKAFHDEVAQLESTIGCLQKELADRHILISSQNEKISQMDGSVRLGATKKVVYENATKAVATSVGGSALDNPFMSQAEDELTEAKQEIERLLRMVQNLERERLELCAKLGGNGQCMVETLSEFSEGKSASELLEVAHKKRIAELEEALQESIGMTSEKEQLIAEQKEQIEQLSNQITELRFQPASKVAAEQLVLAETKMKLAELQKTLEDERFRFQRQLSNFRKELNMALIADKEAVIALLQNPNETLKEKIDALIRQKEHLKHGLLVQDPSSIPLIASDPHVSNFVAHQTHSVFHPHFHQHHLPAGELSEPIRIQTSGHLQHQMLGTMSAGLLSAPASLNYYNLNGEDDGVWA